MRIQQRSLRALMWFYGLRSNLKAISQGKLTWEQLVRLAKRQRVITEFFKDHKFTWMDGKIFIHSYIPYVPSPYFERAVLNNVTETYPLRPTYITIAITSRCPCNCIYCHARESMEEEPTLESMLRIVDDACECGFTVINFSGGEPFSRFEDLLKLVARAKKGMDTRLFTSGVGATPERLRQLKEAGLNGIMISLDHHEEEVHNRQRNNPNAFRAACECIRNASALGLHVEVVSCTTNEDIDSGCIFKTVDFAESLGAHTFQIQAIRPSGKALRSMDANLFLTEKSRQRMVDYFRKENAGPRRISIILPWHDEEPDNFGCTALSGQHAYIDPRGNVQPCSLLALSVGNVKEESFKVIWDRLTSQCEHAGDRCLVFYLASRLSKEEKLPLSPERTYELWNELRQLPKGGVARKLDIKPADPK